MLPPKNLIVIGASTGGTRVLEGMLPLLPPLPAAIVLVQHIPAFITASLLRSLQRRSPMPVRLAGDGAELAEGEIVLVPGGIHCTFQGNRLTRLCDTPPVHYVRPSIDVALHSLQAPPPGQRLFGVLLTGMGRDGAAGLAHLKRLGGLTIAQDEASCAVYGMPAEAVKLGCVDHQLPPAEIVHLLVREIIRQPRPFPSVPPRLLPREWHRTSADAPSRARADVGEPAQLKAMTTPTPMATATATPPKLSTSPCPSQPGLAHGIALGIFNLAPGHATP